MILFPKLFCLARNRNVLTVVLMIAHNDMVH
jgi:hypothetical protein